MITDIMKVSQLVDIRDGKTYKITLIEDTWWMSENLDYGKWILAPVNQENNRIVEKYYFNNDSTQTDYKGGYPQVRSLFSLAKRNQIKTFLFLLALAATISGCETDLDPAMRYQEIPVIFGLIDFDDTEYQVSITKTYLPEGSNNSGIFDKPDIYFDTLNVTLELRYDPESPRFGELGFHQWLSTHEPYGELIIRKEMHVKEIIDSADGSSLMC